MWSVYNLYENRSPRMVWLWGSRLQPCPFKVCPFPHSAVSSRSSHSHVSLFQLPGHTICTVHSVVICPLLSMNTSSLYWVHLSSFLTGPWLLISYDRCQYSCRHIGSVSTEIAEWYSIMRWLCRWFFKYHPWCRNSDPPPHTHTLFLPLLWFYTSSL